MNIRHVVMVGVFGWYALSSAGLAADLQLPLTADATINGNDPNKNFGAATALTVHNYGPKFSLVRFDASTIAGKPVTEAKLTVFLRSIGAAGQLTVYPVVSSWNEGTVTWALQPPSEATAAANVALTTSMAGTTIEIDVTSAAQRWANGTLADAGFLLATVNPIKASFDSKEQAGGIANPATLTVFLTTGPEVVILDLSDPESCSIDAPGYYLIDRTWWLRPHAGEEPNAACGNVTINSAGVTLDLGGFTIYGNGGEYSPVVRINTASGVTLRNGGLANVFVSIEASVAGGTVTLENIRAGGGVLLGNRSVVAKGGSYSGYWEPSLSAGAGSRVTGATFSCFEMECLSVKGSSRVTDNKLSVGTAGPPAIAVIGDDNIVEGNEFNDWIYVGGNRNVVARNFSSGGYINVQQGTANIIEGNIGPGLVFETTGNYFGNNRAHGAFTGVAGNTDWGGNVTY